jgi:glycosyltransferase involved in cell wall biosynthesis
MKVCHWSLFNKSGMNRVAESMVQAEKALGIDSHLCNSLEGDMAKLDAFLDADVHVSHTHLQDAFRKRIKKPYKVVWVAHGTPEHVFTTAVEEGRNKGYGHADGVMLCMNWLRTADAIVTFWPRHGAIWQSLCDKHTKVDVIPLGVDKNFWKPVPTRGKFSGSPSLFTAENSHAIKWPLDLFLMWPWVYPQLEGNPKLHAIYLPNDMHRWFFPLINRNGCSYASHVSGQVFDHDNLRNAFVSTDYYIGLVRYGDFNRVCLEAAACGAKLISYRGNPHAHYWITEGDQRAMAEELIDILSGKTPPFEKVAPVPDVAETAKAMLEIYDRILKQ